MAFFWYYDTQRGSRSRPLGPTGPSDAAGAGLLDLRDLARQQEPVFWMCTKPNEAAGAGLLDVRNLTRQQEPAFWMYET
jgi:hypothetical protein